MERSMQISELSQLTLWPNDVPPELVLVVAARKLTYTTIAYFPLEAVQVPKKKKVIGQGVVRQTGRPDEHYVVDEDGTHLIDIEQGEQPHRSTEEMLGGLRRWRTRAEQEAAQRRILRGVQGQATFGTPEDWLGPDSLPNDPPVDDVVTPDQWNTSALEALSTALADPEQPARDRTLEAFSRWLRTQEGVGPWFSSGGGGVST